MIIAIDFDGTIVTHEFPKIGRDVPHAVRVMKRLQKHGHKLILYTMRANDKPLGKPPSSPEIKAAVGESFLSDAVIYCAAKGIIFWGINENPEQGSWTSSPKAYANIYIDDLAAGCPLIKTQGQCFVDWLKIEEFLTEKGCF